MDNMMGFRPLAAGIAARSGGATDAFRAEIINQLMSMTGMQANSFASMSTEKLSEALSRLQAQAKANEEVPSVPDNLEIFRLMNRQRQPMLGTSITESPGYDSVTNTYTPPLPESNQRYYPEMMAGGGIMSLRGY